MYMLQVSLIVAQSLWAALISGLWGTKLPTPSLQNRVIGSHIGCYGDFDLMGYIENGMKRDGVKKEREKKKRLHSKVS